MASYDILILGATGFTGKLITRYLYVHPERNKFTFAIGARSSSKLNDLAAAVNLDDSVQKVIVDVTKPVEVEEAVKKAKVVINTVGPYWRWGTPVVRACVRHGVHYVDLTGEGVWVKDIINEFDYAATRNHTIIVPACGMDSIPSDYSAYLSYRALPPNSSMGSSTTAYSVKGGISGGTLSTVITMIEEVPKDKASAAAKPYSLSPVRGLPVPRPRLLYRMPYLPNITGGFFVMATGNKAIVQRTWGLLEHQALSTSSSSSPSPPPSASTSISHNENKIRYGPNFVYDEFLRTPSTFSALALSFGLLVGGLSLYFFAPVRWLFKRLVTQPGHGPSEESMQRGFLRVTNVTTTTSSPPVVIKSEIRGKGDPGYLLTSIMISESALSILLSYPSLPPLAHKGGVLTPVTAFGDVLVERLRAGGRFEFEAGILDVESRKDR